MKLLLDANVSWRITSTLKQYFEDCIHVEAVGFETTATDLQIWNYAKENHYTIVTNDADFIRLFNRFGTPPKIILLKTGNQNKLYIVNLLILKKEEIERFINDPGFGILEIIS